MNTSFCTKLFKVAPLCTWAHKYKLYIEKRFSNDKKGGNYLFRGKISLSAVNSISNPLNFELCSIGEFKLRRPT